MNTNVVALLPLGGKRRMSTAPKPSATIFEQADTELRAALRHVAEQVAAAERAESFEHRPRLSYKTWVHAVKQRARHSDAVLADLAAHLVEFPTQYGAAQSYVRTVSDQIRNYTWQGVGEDLPGGAALREQAQAECRAIEGASCWSLILLALADLHRAHPEAFGVESQERTREVLQQRAADGLAALANVPVPQMRGLLLEFGADAGSRDPQALVRRLVEHIRRHGETPAPVRRRHDLADFLTGA
jgi:hypothetical protein